MMPDFPKIYRELSRKGVTLSLLRTEYVAEAQASFFEYDVIGFVWMKNGISEQDVSNSGKDSGINRFLR